MKHFSLGAKVKMTDNAIENYGIQYQNRIFVVSYISKNSEDHPGYDNYAAPDWLYDLKFNDTNEDFGCSLYDYELMSA